MANFYEEKEMAIIRDRKNSETRDYPLSEARSEYEYLVDLRNSDPIRFALARISLKWDALNDIYDKYGTNEEFVYLRKDLREFIRRSALTAEQVADFCAKHPDRWFGSRFRHGYNFKYETKKRN